MRRQSASLFDRVSAEAALPPRSNGGGRGGRGSVHAWAWAVRAQRSLMERCVLPALLAPRALPQLWPAPLPPSSSSSSSAAAPAEPPPPHHLRWSALGGRPGAAGGLVLARARVCVRICAERAAAERRLYLREAVAGLDAALAALGGGAREA